MAFATVNDTNNIFQIFWFFCQFRFAIILSFVQSVYPLLAQVNLVLNAVAAVAAVISAATNLPLFHNDWFDSNHLRCWTLSLTTVSAVLVTAKQSAFNPVELLFNWCIYTLIKMLFNRLEFVHFLYVNSYVMCYVILLYDDCILLNK